MKGKGVLCDTSFFLRLLDPTDPLHTSARGYFKYLLQNDYPLFISTIAVAEYCVGGALEELPLRNLQILPFNLAHGSRTGALAQIVFRKKGTLKLRSRNLIPNDSKLFAQADVEAQIGYYLTADSESEKIYRLLQSEVGLQFRFLNLSTTSHSEAFGVLDL